MGNDWQHEMERYLAHFSRAGKRPSIHFSHHAQATPGWMPAVDMYETDTALVVLYDLAGVDADKTEVQAEAHALTVRGGRSKRHVPSAPDEERSYHALQI